MTIVLERQRSPITASGGTPGTLIGTSSGGVSALTFSIETGGGNIAVNLVANSSTFSQGDKLQVGKEPVLTIQGRGAYSDDYCRALSGEADVNVLDATLQTNGGATLNKANVSFVANCDPSTVKPGGVTRVTGCWNYPGP